MMYVRTLSVLLLAAAFAGADWPRFRGPNGQGHGDSRDLPVSWSEQVNVAWKRRLPGSGWSSPVVLGGQVWLTTALDQGRSLRALCVDQNSGKLVHNVEVFAPDKPGGINERNSHASPTPTIEPGGVYVHFGNRGTARVSTESGEVSWRNESLRFKQTHGPTSSPVLFEDLLILQFDGPKEKLVVALSRQTGKVIWRRARSAPYRENTLNHQAHTTPIVASRDGQPQLISVAADQTHSYDPRTGDELWHVRYEGFANVACPVLVDANADTGPNVCISTGFGKTELWSLQMNGSGDVTESHVAWRAGKQMPKLPTPIVVNNRIFTVSDQGVASCLDTTTGERIWQARLGGNYSASPVFGDGKLYFSSEDGSVTVMKPADEPRILAVNKLSGTIKATPAIVDRAIFLRTDCCLYRLEKFCSE